MKGTLRWLMTAALASLPYFAQAGEWCWKEASDRYGVDPWLLYSIAKKESGLNNHAVNVNSNGTEDVCMMQINSSHFVKLAKHGITRTRLLNDPCLCINVGAWVLSNAYAHYGVEWGAGPHWQSVGSYNAGMSPTPKQERRRQLYAHDVARIYDEVRSGRP